MKKLFMLALFFLTITFLALNVNAETVKQIVSKKNISYQDLNKLNALVKQKAHFTVADLRKLLRNYVGDNLSSGADDFNSIGKTTTKIKKIQGNWNNSYIRRGSFAKEKSLALLVSDILKTYPYIYKNINKQGNHYETALYIAAARQMPHVLYILLNDGYINPAITSISNHKIFLQQWKKERLSTQNNEATTTMFFSASNTSFPYQAYNVNKNKALSVYVNKKLLKMTEYLLYCRHYVSNGIDTGECFKYSIFQNKNMLYVYFPAVSSYPNYIPFPPFKPTAANNPYKKWKPKYITNNPQPAGFWSSVNRY